MVTTRSGRGQTTKKVPISNGVVALVSSSVTLKAQRRSRKSEAMATVRLAKKTLTESVASTDPSRGTNHASTQKTKLSRETKSKSTSHKKEAPLLMTLPPDIVMGELRSRPSKRNRSPYVGDVWLEDEQREAIVHLPNLDMGGKCVPGSTLILKPARDKKGNLVGKDATSPKYGTPKCEFIAQLLRVDESDLGYEPAWVGAHPSLGEKIAEELLRRNFLGPDFPTVQSFQREVHNVGGTDMRADFLIQHKDSTLPPRILEVKTVVDTDYAPLAIPTNRTKCIFTSDQVPYIRTGIFPWGNSNQKGPDGEAVVSARAIKHIRELTRMVKDLTKSFSATILFVVIRHDAKAFRPNVDACPSFAKYLKQARDAGVQVLAKQVVWGEDNEIGKCYEGDLLDITWP